jgi:hypothetical protein
MDTERSLYEIEIALAKSDNFNYIRNIVAFNVHGLSDTLALFHECDMLVLSKSGYLTEIEIKRSYSDFLADFKKDHAHESGIIKYFYYCVPESISDKVYNKLTELKANYTGVITYNENLQIVINGHRYINMSGEVKYNIYPEQYPFRKLFLEEQLQVARFGAMRAVMLREKLFK